MADTLRTEYAPSSTLMVMPKARWVVTALEHSTKSRVLGEFDGGGSMKIVVMPKGQGWYPGVFLSTHTLDTRLLLLYVLYGC